MTVECSVKGKRIWASPRVASNTPAVAVASRRSMRPESFGSPDSGPAQALRRAEVGQLRLREAGHVGCHLSQEPTNVDLPLIFSRRTHNHASTPS